MDTQSSLLAEIERHIERTGIAETTFGRLAVNDGKFVSRLRAEANMTIKTITKVRQYLDAQKIVAAPEQEEAA
jgi:hypothetical protein